MKERTEPVQLLFTDIVLPNGMNGTVLAERAMELRPDMKVLFTTGYARDAVLPNSRSHLRADLIKKPYSFADLASKVRDILENGVPEQDEDSRSMENAAGGAPS